MSVAEGERRRKRVGDVEKIVYDVHCVRPESEEDENQARRKYGRSDQRGLEKEG